MYLKSIVTDDELQKNSFVKLTELLLKDVKNIKILVFLMLRIYHILMRLVIFGEISFERFHFLTRSFDDKGNGSRLSACMDVLDYIEQIRL